MTLLHLLRIITAQRRLILICLLLGLAAAVAWAVMQPKRYAAAAQVLIGVRAPDTVGNEAPVAQLQPDYLATQADVIRSDRVANDAVSKLGLDTDPALLAQYRASDSSGDAAHFFADQLKDGLNVSTSATSRVITIGFASPDPLFAARAANAFADAYRSVTLDLQVEPARQAAGWYDDAAADLTKKLAAAQARLNARSAALGVTAGEDVLDSEITRLNSLSGQLASAQAGSAIASARQIGGATPDALLNPVAQSLQNDIARLEAQRRQLATYAGPNNTDYQQVVSQLSSLRQQLGEQRSLVAQSAGTGAAQGAASVRELSAAVAAQKQRVIQSRASRGDVAALQQDVDNLKATYVQLVAKRSQVNLLGSGGQTNVAVLSSASVPQSPSGLPVPVKLLLGALGGLVAGLGLALAREFVDQRIRSSDDADIWLGIPDLGGIRPLQSRRPMVLLRAAQRYLPAQSEAAAG